MSLKASLRTFHRKIAPWALPSILLLTFTGLAYRVGRSWLGMSPETGDWVMSIHTGAGLGTTGSVMYLIVIGTILALLVLSGLWMLITSKASKASVRRAHQVLAMVFFLPLLISAVTGMAYHIGDVWLPMSDGTKDLLMDLHEGGWMGKTLKPFYIVLLTAGTLGLGFTGLRMVFRARSN